MKIIHLIWSLDIGGLESMIVDLINEQAKSADVHLIIINNIIKDSLLKKIAPKITIHKINRRPGSRNLFIPLIINIKLCLIKPDILHAHKYDTRELIFVSRFLKMKMYLTVHSTQKPTSNFHKFDKIFAISNAVKQDIITRSEVCPITVYNGINDTSITTRQPDFPSKRIRVLQIGRLVHKIKGQHIALLALADIVNKRNIKNITVDFIGEGPSIKYLIKLATEQGILQYCNFIGALEREEIYNNLSKYDLLIQPSLHEGFGLTVAEALAAKVPVLISDIEGPMEIIQNGKYGFHFKSGDSINCADKIFEIINSYHSKDMSTKINKGYLYVKNNFSIRKTAKEYLYQYDK